MTVLVVACSYHSTTNAPYSFVIHTILLAAANVSSAWIIIRQNFKTLPWLVLMFHLRSSYGCHFCLDILQGWSSLVVSVECRLFMGEMADCWTDAHSLLVLRKEINCFRTCFTLKVEMQVCVAGYWLINNSTCALKMWVLFEHYRRAETAFNRQKTRPPFWNVLWIKPVT